MAEDHNMSVLWDFCNSLEDKELKEAFSDALNELSAYRSCGSVEECESRKEWMSFSLDDVRRKYIEFVRMMRSEMELDKKNKGRKRKI